MNNNSLLEYKNRVFRVSKYTLIILAIFLIAVITPYQTIFLGLALGTIVGLLNFLYTAWKINKIGEVASASDEVQKTKPAFSGMFTRFSTAVLAIMVVYQFPDYLDVIATLVGLFTTQIVATVDGIINNF